MAKTTRKKQAPARKKTAKKTARRKTVRRPAKKTTARKKTTRKGDGTPKGLGSSKVVKADNVQYAGGKPSVYQPMFDALKKLRPGQAYEVEVPKGSTVADVHNRLQAAFRRGKVQSFAPKGKMFVKRTTANSTIAITLVKRP